MTPAELARLVGAEAGAEMASALARIRHCVDQLSEAQVWWRSRPDMNSIGNLILHLCGNVRQWLIAGLGGAPDTRNRPAEFAERGPLPKDDMLRRLDQVVQEARHVLERQTAEELLRPRLIQGSHVTGLQALFNSVPHFRGHTQEIIHITRLQLGDAYRIAWQPTTREEGALG